MGIVVDEVILEQVSFKYFSFPWQFLFYQMLHASLSSGAKGPIVAGVAPHPTPINKQQEVLGRIFVYFPLKLREPHRKGKKLGGYTDSKVIS
jgi:hypothetical protein